MPVPEARHPETVFDVAGEGVILCPVKLPCKTLQSLALTGGVQPFLGHI